MFPGWGPTIAAAIVAFVVGYVVIIGFLVCFHLLVQGIAIYPSASSSHCC